MTASEETRLAKVEQRMDDLCQRFDRVEGKLDKALETKADKSELTTLAALVDDQRVFVRGLLVKTAIGALGVIGAVALAVFTGHLHF
jgi:hypothetical protein